MQVRSERIARQHRMNIGTIVDLPTLKVRYAGGMGGASARSRRISSPSSLPATPSCSPASLLRFLRLRETMVEVADGGEGEPKVPTWAGGRMPMTTNLADRVRRLLQDASTWHLFPEPVREWLALQKARSRLPGRDDLLVESFPRGDRWYLVAYCFEGRQAHQTLGLLVTRRMERFGNAAAGVRGDRLRAGLLVGEAADRCRAAVRGRHAGRRPGSLDGGKLDAAAHLPQRRGDRRADRAADSGGDQEPPAGHGEQRPAVQCAAPPSAGPCAAARHARRCGGGADGSRPRCRDAGAHPGTGAPHGAVAGQPAGGAGAAGDRPRERAPCRRRRPAAGGGGAGRRGDGRRPNRRRPSR